MDTRTTGIEKVFYSEAIEQMYNNENLQNYLETFKIHFFPSGRFNQICF